MSCDWKLKNPLVYLDIAIGNSIAGKIVIETPPVALNENDKAFLQNNQGGVVPTLIPSAFQFISLKSDAVLSVLREILQLSTSATSVKERVAASSSAKTLEPFKSSSSANPQQDSKSLILSLTKPK